MTVYIVYSRKLHCTCTSYNSLSVKKRYSNLNNTLKERTILPYFNILPNEDTVSYLSLYMLPKRFKHFDLYFARVDEGSVYIQQIFSYTKYQ